MTIMEVSEEVQLEWSAVTVLLKPLWVRSAEMLSKSIVCQHLSGNPS